MNKNNVSPGELVFVSLYVGLGDGDGSIEGNCIMPKDEWEKDVAVFEADLKARNGEPIDHDSVWGCYTVEMDAYEVKPCTAEEAVVIEKFFGKSSGDFRRPSEFTEKNY